MSKFGKDKSNLTQNLNEAQKDVMSEFDLQYSINELASILGKSESLEHPIVYTAEAVPVFIYKKEDGSSMFIVEQENLDKLMNSQDIDVSTALNQLKSSLDDQLTTTIDSVELKDLYVIFTKEDIDQLQDLCSCDPNRIDSRCEAVTSYTKFVNKIISEGAHVIFGEREAE
jgi:hypothetical protein